MTSPGERGRRLDVAVGGETRSSPQVWGTHGLAPAAVRRHAGAVTSRIGALIILAGAALIAVRAVGLVDSEAADIAATLAIVVGALAVAIDGENADTNAPSD